MGIVTMVLQPDVAAVRPPSTLDFVPLLLVRHRRPFDEIGDEDPVHMDSCLRTEQRNDHRVPIIEVGHYHALGAVEAIETAGAMPRITRVIDLYFIAVIHPFPWITRRVRNPNENSGVVVAGRE